VRLNGIAKLIIILFCLGGVGLVGAKWDSFGNDEQIDYQLALATARDFEITVRTVGVLDAARSHMVSSAVRGDKGKIIFLVEDGSHVKDGDVLVQLDPTPFEEETHRLTDEVRNLEAAVEAEQQILEWEKNQVEKEIKTAEFNVKVARLEHERLIKGEGPIQLTQYRTEMEKAKQEQEKYVAYITELEKLNANGFTNPTEMTLAKQKFSELKEQQLAAESKYASYKEHVLPSLRETARAKIEKAQMELEQTKNGSVYKIAKAAAALNKSKSKLAGTQSDLLRAKKELDKSVIKAPFQGIAILFEAFRNGQKRKPRVGDNVWQNQPLLYLPDISSMIVKTKVREVDLHKIFLDQHCLVTVDAYPEGSFEGKVSFIGVLATDHYESGSGEKYFQISIAVQGEDSRLRPGMTARTTILSEQLKDTLSIPVQAVFPEGGDDYCYLFNGYKFKKEKIAIGNQNEDFVKVISGLKDGDRVSLVKPASEMLN
jgi:HlyD family secretion protein